jgi:hypothetical protein
MSNLKGTPVANDEHLAILAQGVEVWNEWRALNPDTMPGRRDVKLSRRNLADADLSWANISGANISGAELQRADLKQSDLSGANLGRARLHGLTSGEQLSARRTSAGELQRGASS